jgi:hypothetical protein
MPRSPDLHWTCHGCGLPIEEQESVIIIGRYIYHPQHQPVMNVLNGEHPTQSVRAPALVVAGGDDW